MKSFRKENEKEYVVVTLESLLVLYYVYEDIPKSIFSKIMQEPSVIDCNTNRYEDDRNKYIKFSKKAEIEYFKNINWIYDFDKYLEMPKAMLESKYKGISDVLEALNKKRKEDGNNPVLKAECIKKQYELESIKIILNIKSNMPEPEYSNEEIRILKKR